MATIVFAPYPETGHLNATFKIAKALKARGHRLRYLGLADFAEPVRRQGFEFTPILEDLFPVGFMRQHAVSRNIDNFAAVLLKAKSERRPINLPQHLQRFAAEARPDVLVIDLLLSDLALVAVGLGLRTVLFNTQLFNPWADEPAGYAPLAGQPELILCPQEFDFPGTVRKPGSHYVESSIDLAREEPPFDWSRLNPQKPLVFCSFGSQSHLLPGSERFFRVAAEALAERPEWQLLLTVGTNLDPADFPAPPNVLLVKFAPQLEVLRRASLMLTHGGFNSVKECIYFGVPMLVFPVIRDHPAIAARVVYHRLGLMADPRECTAGQLLGLLDRLQRDESYRARVEALGQTFRAAEEAARGVEIIESVANPPQQPH
ncbi:MAG: glycosyltransferase family 1 protein [Acidobacteria bacterium]|nr:glycosyltransferase family 1 protein [Acidobacteriota bacterium]